MVDWRVVVDDKKLKAMTTTFLRETEKEVEKETVKIASRFASQLAKNVPEGEGDLKDTIKEFPSRNGETFGHGVSIGDSDSDFARQLEFGHKARDGSIVPAARFFYPLASKYNKMMKAALRRAMKRVYARFA